MQLTPLHIVYVRMNNAYPKNLLELMDMFPDEEACLEYLQRLRWPDGYQCIRCSGKTALYLGNDNSSESHL